MASKSVVRLIVSMTESRMEGRVFVICSRQLRYLSADRVGNVLRTTTSLCETFGMVGQARTSLLSGVHGTASAFWNRGNRPPVVKEQPFSRRGSRPPTTDPLFILVYQLLVPRYSKHIGNSVIVRSFLYYQGYHPPSISRSCLSIRLSQSMQIATCESIQPRFCNFNFNPNPNRPKPLKAI
jgi:hypothetical protein